MANRATNWLCDKCGTETAFPYAACSNCGHCGPHTAPAMPTNPTDQATPNRCSFCNYPEGAHSDVCRVWHNRQDDQAAPSKCAICRDDFPELDENEMCDGCAEVVDPLTSCTRCGAAKTYPDTTCPRCQATPMEGLVRIGASVCGKHIKECESCQAAQESNNYRLANAEAKQAESDKRIGELEAAFRQLADDKNLNCGVRNFASAALKGSSNHGK